MSNFWITTHWPTPSTAPSVSRHVYVKEKHKSRPSVGDFIFIRESESRPKFEGNEVKRVTMLHRGKTSEHDLPKGSGGIIGTAIVGDSVRDVLPEDVVFEYGNLRD